MISVVVLSSCTNQSVRKDEDKFGLNINTQDILIFTDVMVYVPPV